ncbi:MAG: single-stranded-DNA-specific exonuclease RecJ [Eubacterium sp.]|nr:single-stranded-DNA-specific exonuclease RecJ [Eubacterium sp.]
MAYKKWIIADADKERASELSEKFNIDPFVAFLLVARGIKSDLEVSGFLSSSYEFADPFLLKDMDKAVERIEQAIDYGEKITVYGDYDCDGVTSTALLYTLLRDMGADVDYYIPLRLEEGYGMNMSAIDKIKERGTKLIITVDNGISAIEEADYIYSLGMELVVTDHHRIGDSLPRAEAVIDPHREDNDIPFRDFAGVGVAFKLACALYGDTEDMLYRFSELVAIGTVADVVPLKGENRALVRMGLSIINSDPCYAVQALKKAAGLGDKRITASDIAFIISPRINAAGRVDTATRALELFIADDLDTAVFKAEQLNVDNTHRQELEQSVFDDVKLKIAENPALAEERVIVISGDNYDHGVVGLAASRILEEYGKPTIIIGIDENGVARGSARSVDGFNIFEAISYCFELLSQFGGHPKAAGLSIDPDKIDDFRARINEYAKENFIAPPVQTLNIDCKLSPFYLTLELAKSLKALEPFGEGNSEALFALMGLTVVSVTPIGNGKHIRLECEKKGKKLRIVKFGCPQENFPFTAGDKIDAAVKISVNPYNGKEYLSVQAVDIRKSKADGEKYFREKEIFELFEAEKSNDASVFPSREICSAVYRFLKSKGGWRCGIDELYFALEGVTYGQLRFALKAFEESGLINVSGGVIEICAVGSKVDLMNTPVMKALKGRIGLV